MPIVPWRYWVPGPTGKYVDTTFTENDTIPLGAVPYWSGVVGNGKPEDLMLPNMASLREVIVPVEVNGVLEDHKVLIDVNPDTFSDLEGAEAIEAAIVVDFGKVTPRDAAAAAATPKLVFDSAGKAGWITPGEIDPVWVPQLDDLTMASDYAAPASGDTAANITAAKNRAEALAEVQKTAASDLAEVNVTAATAADERAIAAAEEAASVARDVVDAKVKADQEAAAVLTWARQNEQEAAFEFEAMQKAADREQTQQQINAEIYNNNAARADNRVQQEFLRDKFAVEVAMGRDAQVLQTEIALDDSVRSGRQLTFQYQQLQQTAQQFNATGEMQAAIENQRRMELQEARRAQLATNIGVTAQDAGSRGELAARLLANPNLGSLDAGLAGGEDFFTEESLVPLTDLLGQRADAAKDPNFLEFNPITATGLPNIATPQFTPPGEYIVPELGAASGDYVPPPVGVSPAPNRGFLQEPVSMGQQRVTAMGDEHARLMAAGVGTDSDQYKTAMDAVTPTPEYTARHGGMNVGAQLTELPQSVLDDPRYPGNPNFEMKADGGLASGAYIGDEKGPELHIPLGLGEALVIPHDQVKNFLRKASEHGAGAMKKGGKPPEDSVAADLAGMGFGAMELGGVFDKGTIFGTARPTDQTGTRNFLNEALKRALTGTPWQGQGRAPTPVEVSAQGTDPMVRELAASLSALGTGTPQDVFLRRAAALTPRGISERAGGVRRTA
jgi:hypothetical protein